MAKKTVEVNEDDFKKIMLMLKYSKEFLKLPPDDLFLSNLWRVASKMVDKIVKKAGYMFVESKGRKTLKNLEDVQTEVTETLKPFVGEENTEEVREEAATAVVDSVLGTPKEETSTEETPKVPRCRKRKIKN